MKTWFFDRVIDFGHWLEYWAGAINEWAWLHRPRSKRNDDLSKIINATLVNMSGPIADNLTRNNALLKRLSEGK